MPVVGNILPDVVTGFRRSGYHTDSAFQQVAETLLHLYGPVRGMPVDLEEKVEWDLKDLKETMDLELKAYEQGVAPHEVWMPYNEMK